MLTGKNIVLTKIGETILSKEYDRKYYEAGGADVMEDYSKTFDGSDVAFTDGNYDPKGTKWVGQRPKESTSTVPVKDLLQEMVNDIQTSEAAKVTEDPKYTPKDPWLVILQAASTQLDTWIANDLRTGLKPAKPVSKEAAREKIAKLLLASGQAANMPEAYKMADMLTQAQAA